jgi:fluoroacetyl-CoA thioesterase
MMRGCNRRLPAPKTLPGWPMNGQDDASLQHCSGHVMRPIPLGARGSFKLLVQPEHLANRFKDAMLPPVFATPVMIMVMENAALNAIKAYLDPGESAVGTAVNVRHLVATPVGRQVTGEAEVTKVDGRQIKFTVRATEGGKAIGAGSHSRVVIDVAKFARRLGS